MLGRQGGMSWFPPSIYLPGRAPHPSVESVGRLHPKSRAISPIVEWAGSLYLKSTAEQ